MLQQQCQQLQARIAQLEKALKRVHHLASSEGPKPVAWALEESYNVADAAISADPSPVVEVVRAAVEWAQHRTDSDKDYGEILEDAVYNLAPEWKQ